jgi:hypothetical protein
MPFADAQWHLGDTHRNRNVNRGRRRRDLNARLRKPDLIGVNDLTFQLGRHEVAIHTASVSRMLAATKITRNSATKMRLLRQEIARPEKHPWASAQILFGCLCPGRLSAPHGGHRDQCTSGHTGWASASD